MTARTPDERRATLLSTVLLLVVFVAGALTGAVVLDAAFAAPAADPDVVASGGLEALGLTASQREEIDRILAVRQPAADSIVRTSIRELRALMEAADGEVRSVLTAEQLVAYDSLLSHGPRIRAVRRTIGPDGAEVADTIR